jgi:Xaa-Pro dipeptidase
MAADEPAVTITLLAPASAGDQAVTNPSLSGATAPIDDAFAHRGASALDAQMLFGELYRQHLATLSQRLEGQLARTGHDQLLLTAGQARMQLFDDLPASFRSNPHLRHWLPLDATEGCALTLRPGARPRLHFLKPADYWHLVAEVPAWAQAHFEVLEHATRDALTAAVKDDLKGRNGSAMVGDPADHSAFPGALSNPQALLAELDFDRGIKTPFEQRCMQLATRRGVAGHRAAEQAFCAGASEFEIHHAYLKASLQTEGDLPYGNIVALNTHAAVLHYQHQDRDAPEPSLSLLIDAGARCQGYASDITRTYAAAPGAFQDLVTALDAQQQALIQTIRPGQSYLALHEDMHRRLAELLVSAGVFRCSAEQGLEAGLTLPFMPHGLGHLIGLQTHDVAGQSQRDGTLIPPPDAYPALRTTREVAIDQVFTIEPGLYFIPMLLDPVLAGAQGRLLDAEVINALAPYGGIRIEDNVIVREHDTWNLTREAFKEQAHAS